MEKFTNYYSATVLGIGNNNGIYLKENSEYIFKSYYKLRTDGIGTYKLFFVNRVETTGNCRAGKKGDEYKIVEGYAAYSPDKRKEEGKVKITFGGMNEKTVAAGEKYSTDEFEFKYKKDGYMVLTFRVLTKDKTFLPATNESASTGIVIENGCEKQWDNFALRPFFVGVEKKFDKTVGFWGDSVTQGARTGIDKYEAWSHRAANYMPDNISSFNIGMGWARAYDACEEGVFFEKASMCDELIICFGINDIKAGGRKGEEVIADITKACRMLRERNKDIKLHLLTVPPFNMSAYEEEQRVKVNEFVRAKGGYFDIAKCLEQDDEGKVKREYMTDEDDAHPNGAGGEAVFKEFVLWAKRIGL